VITTTDLEYTITGLTGGQEYGFTIKALNKYGFSSASEALVYLAAQVPDQVDKPQITLFDSYVYVQWVEPFNNYVPVIGYQIYLQDKTGVDADVTLMC